MMLYVLLKAYLCKNCKGFKANTAECNDWCFLWTAVGWPWTEWQFFTLLLVCHILLSVVCLFYLIVGCTWCLNISPFSVFSAVWQRGRELWQVLHTHAAPAHTTWWAGYCQHRPGRVCRVFFHQCTVCAPFARQQCMRRMVKPLKNLPVNSRPTKPTIDI